MAAYNATRPVPIVATTEYQAVAAARTAAGLPSFAATAPYEYIFTGAIYLNKYNAMKLTATDTFKYTPAPVCTTSATCLVLLTQQRQGTSGGLVTSTPGQAISAYVESKAIQELFDADYGRMNATLGVELPFTSVNNQTTVPSLCRSRNGDHCAGRDAVLEDHAQRCGLPPGAFPFVERPGHQPRGLGRHDQATTTR